MDFPVVSSTSSAIKSISVSNKNVKIQKLASVLYDKATLLLKDLNSISEENSEKLIDGVKEILSLSSEIKELIGGVKNAQKNSSLH